MDDDTDTLKSLSFWYDLGCRTIISLQDPVTGLIPAQPGSDTWVRDCTYALHSVWALTLAYEKLLVPGESTTVYHELKGRTVKGLRGLLYCMMRQQDKVYRFIETQSPTECLHAKYDTRTGNTAVGDQEWGHLQMDATSLFLLTLAQVTSSGIVVIQSLSEVDFVQKLVQYIMFAYRTPDFGVFERGDKNNRGIRELSCCSVGLAKAALVGMRNLNLFGANGGLRSVIKVPLELSRQCSRVLQSILPRGSASKEFDSSVWSILTYPAFALEDDEQARLCKDLLEGNLKGRYGYKRFLMDGYKTPLEDTQRLHYNTGELKSFEGIECEWPLYTIFSWLDALFNEDKESARTHRLKLDNELVVYNDRMDPIVPEFYYVPLDNVAEEKRCKGSQKRLCGGKIPFVWAQSLYILAGLLHDGHISPSDIDPLNRRLSSLKKPSPLVQILLVTQDEAARNFAEAHNLQHLPLRNTTTTPHHLTVITPGIVSRIWENLGFTLPRNDYSYAHNKVSSLRTSIIYQFRNRYYISVPEYAYRRVFYDNMDTEVFIRKTIARLSYLSTQWFSPGRPTLLMLLDENKVTDGEFVRFLQTLKSGSYLGIQVKIVSADVALTTAAKEQIPTMPELVCAVSGLHTTAEDSTQYCGPTNSDIFTVDDATAVPEEFGTDDKYDIEARWSNICKYFQQRIKMPISLKPILEDLYIRACEHRHWYIIRHCAALLQKTHHSLCDDVTHLLVNQKQISFGRGDQEETITQPPSAAVMIDYFIRHSKANYLFFSLYQEVLMCLTQEAQKNISLFKGILRLRLDLVIGLLARNYHHGDSAVSDIEKLCHQSPIAICKSVYRILSGSLQLEDSEAVVWQERRFIDGCLNRLPPKFHVSLYALLSTSSGVSVRDHRFPSFPTVNEMTAGEPQFSLLVEDWLDGIPDPELRQLYVEVILLLAHIQPSLVDLSFNGKIIQLEEILRAADAIFIQENEVRDEVNLDVNGICQAFCNLPPSGRFGTLSYISKAIVSLAP